VTIDGHGWETDPPGPTAPGNKLLDGWSQLDSPGLKELDIEMRNKIKFGININHVSHDFI